MLAAILLAAGGSRRFGRTNKLLADWRGRPLVDHALDHLLALPAQRLIVVTGRDRARIERVARARHDPRLRLVYNPRWCDGLGGSVACGIAAIAPVHRLLLIALADMPRGGGALPPLLQAVRGGAAAARPVVNGQEGHPVLIRRSAIVGADATGDSGLWPMLVARGLRLGRVSGPPVALLDIDDPIAIRRLRRRAAEPRQPLPRLT